MKVWRVRKRAASMRSPSAAPSGLGLDVIYPAPYLVELKPHYTDSTRQDAHNEIGKRDRAEPEKLPESRHKDHQHKADDCQGEDPRKCPVRGSQRCPDRFLPR